MALHHLVEQAHNFFLVPRSLMRLTSVSHVPVLGDVNFAFLKAQRMSRSQFLYSVKQCRGPWNKFIANRVIERLAIDTSGHGWVLENGFDLGGKNEARAFLEIVKRLDADAITRHKKLLTV